MAITFFLTGIKNKLFIRIDSSAVLKVYYIIYKNVTKCYKPSIVQQIICIDFQATLSADRNHTATRSLLRSLCVGHLNA